VPKSAPRIRRRSYESMATGTSGVVSIQSVWAQSPGSMQVIGDVCPASSESPRRGPAARPVPSSQARSVIVTHGGIPESASVPACARLVADSGCATTASNEAVGARMPPQPMAARALRKEPSFARAAAVCDGRVAHLSVGHRGGQLAYHWPGGPVECEDPVVPEQIRRRGRLLRAEWDRSGLRLANAIGSLPNGEPKCPRRCTLLS